MHVRVKMSCYIVGHPVYHANQIVTLDDDLAEKLIAEKVVEKVIDVDEQPFELTEDKTEKTTEEQDLNNLTASELKGLCKERGLSTTGNKATLIARLQDDAK